MMMDGARKSSPSRSGQRGIVSIVAAILLIAVVVFILSQTYGIIGNTSNSNAAQGDSVKALFLAESGVERAKGVYNQAISTGATITNATCTGIGSGGPFTVGSGSGSGSFSYGTAISEPLGLPCTGASCTGCTVSVTGTVNNAKRTLTQKYSFASTLKGTAKCGPLPKLQLINQTDFAAVGMFNLAWRRNLNAKDYVDLGCPGTDFGTNSNASFNCDGNSCDLKWNVESSGGGQDSVGSMGFSVEIPKTDSYSITAPLTSTRTYSFVGVLFPGFSDTLAPAIKGAYWDDASGGGGGDKTIAGSSDNTGRTNNGIAPPAGTCTTPLQVMDNKGSKQMCTGWCSDADTLVYSFSGRSEARTNEMTQVVFDTGTGRQNITMTAALNRVTHYPDTAGTLGTGDVYSEIWYAHNEQYIYGAQTTGTIAINTTSGFTANTTIGSNELDVTGLGTGTLKLGDKLTGTGIPLNTMIIAFGTGSGGLGTYTMSANATTTNSTSLSSSGQVLTVATVHSGTLKVGQMLSGGGIPTNTATILLQGPGTSGSNGTYYLDMSSPTAVSTVATIVAGASMSNSTTISVPNAASLPEIGTILVVSYGTGVLDAQSTVLSRDTGTNTFTVALPASPKVADAPSTALAGAQLRGGTFAFFNNTSTTSTTSFEITTPSVGSADTTQWASGFVCLSGVDKSKITAVTDISSVTATKWAEVVTP